MPKMNTGNELASPPAELAGLSTGRFLHLEDSLILRAPYDSRPPLQFNITGDSRIERLDKQGSEPPARKAWRLGRYECLLIDFLRLTHGQPFPCSDAYAFIEGGTTALRAAYLRRAITSPGQFNNDVMLGGLAIDWTRPPIARLARSIIIRDERSGPKGTHLAYRTALKKTTVNKTPITLPGRYGLKQPSTPDEREALREAAKIALTTQALPLRDIIALSLKRACAFRGLKGIVLPAADGRRVAYNNVAPTPFEEQNGAASSLEYIAALLGLSKVTLQRTVLPDANRIIGQIIAETVNK